MNIAIITAGGTGQRMHTKNLPKQFLRLYGKPILIYTLEQFDRHEEIDEIILVCVEEYIPYCSKLLEEYKIKKVSSIVSGGKSGFESIHNGLFECSTRYSDDDIVLIHDGVRPLIDKDTISNNITAVKEYGSAITVSAASETIA